MLQVRERHTDPLLPRRYFILLPPLCSALLKADITKQSQLPCSDDPRPTSMFIFSPAHQEPNCHSLQQRNPTCYLVSGIPSRWASLLSCHLIRTNCWTDSRRIKNNEAVFQKCACFHQGEKWKLRTTGLKMKSLG